MIAATDFNNQLAKRNGGTSFAVLLLFGLMILSGCNYSDLKIEPGPVGKLNGEPGSSVDYATVKAQVFEPMCLRCHSDATPKGKVKLDTYNDAFPHVATIKSEVADGSMPPRGAPVSPAQRALLFAWIDAGAPENTVVPTPAPSPTPVASPTPSPTPGPTPTPTPVASPTPSALPDFATVSREVFQPYCLKCHSAAKHKGDVILETYVEAIKHLKDIRDDVDMDVMPAKAPPLDPKSKDLLFRWIDGGAPETVP